MHLRVFASRGEVRLSPPSHELGWADSIRWATCSAKIYAGQNSWSFPQQADSNRQYLPSPLPPFVRSHDDASPFLGYHPESRESAFPWSEGTSSECRINFDEIGAQDDGRIPLGGIGGVEDSDWDRPPGRRQSAPYPQPPYGGQNDIDSYPFNNNFPRPRHASVNEYAFQAIPRPIPPSSNLGSFPSPSRQNAPSTSSYTTDLYQNPPPYAPPTLPLEVPSPPLSPGDDRSRRDRDRADAKTFLCGGESFFVLAFRWVVKLIISILVECPLAFHRGHDLKRHQRIHLEVKPYPCPSCEKRE